ncbi:hypothetical protein D9M68_765650 [compost metagenome]
MCSSKVLASSGSSFITAPSSRVGAIASTEFAQRLQQQYGWTTEKSELVAGVVLGSLGGAGKAPKTKYQPNQGSVANMGDYLKQPGFGSELAGAVRKTNQKYQGQTIFQATKDNGSTIKKGDQLYLDGAHKNHLEVFDKKGTPRLY